jgi:peptidyl-tRNA hydrolase
MKYKIYYDKTLKLSDGKLAAQCSHVSKELGRMTKSNHREDIIVVLGLSHTKFTEMLDTIKQHEYHHTQVDLGMTEIEAGTITTCGYVEEV